MSVGNNYVVGISMTNCDCELRLCDKLISFYDYNIIDYIFFLLYVHVF